MNRIQLKDSLTDGMCESQIYYMCQLITSHNEISLTSERDWKKILGPVVEEGYIKLYGSLYGGLKENKKKRTPKKLTEHAKRNQTNKKCS